MIQEFQQRVSRACGCFALALLFLAPACAEDSDRDAGANAVAEPPAAVASPALAAPQPTRVIHPPADAGDSTLQQAEVLALAPEGMGLDELLRILREDPDPRIRESAVVALANSEDGRVIDALIAATEDPERRVALAAIELLSWTEDRQAEATLARLRGSDDPEIAAAAESTLVR